MELPVALAPWATELALFPPEIATGLGELVRKLSLVVGPMRADRTIAREDGSGFDGIDRRGSYERLLLTEWLLADELPDEFTRRAANNEHMFLRPARTGPARARGSIALFDAGPSQLGAPRIAQLALLIVLARRAAAAGAGFRWGILQAEELALRDDVTSASVLSFLAARTTRSAERARIEGLAGDEVWIIGGERATSLARASTVLVRDELTLGASCVNVEVRVEGSAPRRATLELPSARATARLLRDPFDVATQPSTPAARVGVPHGNLVFGSSATKLYARTTDGVLAIPVPNSPRAGVGAPKLRRAHGVIAAAGTHHQRATLLVADEPTRSLSLYSNQRHHRIGVFTSTEGPHVPWQPLGTDPLRPLLFRGEAFAFVDSRGWLFEFVGSAPAKLIAREALAAQPIPGGYGYIARPVDAGGQWMWVAATVAETKRTPLGDRAQDDAFFSIGWSFDAPTLTVVLGRKEERAFAVIEGSSRTQLDVPARARVIGVQPSVHGSRSFGLLVVDADGCGITSISLANDTRILSTTAPIVSAVVDPQATVLAVLTEDDKLILHSLAKNEHRHTFDFTRKW